MRNAMIVGFPLTGSLRKRVQHIWNAYVSWGMESPAKRRAMMQLTVSERITDQSRQEGARFDVLKLVLAWLWRSVL